MGEKVYAAIDLKSFYASVECVERGLDALSTNLLVADISRTEKTICLAVSPSLKKYGISGRARLFEANQILRKVNSQRQKQSPGAEFTGSSYDAKELERNPSLKIDYIAAPPRMALYMEYSSKIYSIYLRHVAPEDIHPYSIDEVFIDITPHLKRTGMSARDFVTMLIREVLKETGITATAGIGPNLYLCKIAMDITAKHIPPDKDGVRIAELDEMTYRTQLWDHRPITDFWRVGKGTADRLANHYIYTMGDIARCSVYNEQLLYRLFGINAELLIDHAWGWEPCSISDIKSYKPSSRSISSGQVLQEPYSFEKAKLIVREMIDALVLDLVRKRLVCDHVVLYIGYDVENLKDPSRMSTYSGDIKLDHYGRAVPKSARGTASFGKHTSSARIITEKVLTVYEQAVEKNLLIRRITLAAGHILPEDKVLNNQGYEQISLFTDIFELERQQAMEESALNKERKMQDALIFIKSRYGKNAILRGTNFQEGATARERNAQIGGHKA